MQYGIVSDKVVGFLIGILSALIGTVDEAFDRAASGSDTILVSSSRSGILSGT